MLRWKLRRPEQKLSVQKTPRRQKIPIFYFKEKKIPVVCVDGIYLRLATDLVSSTKYQGAFEAGEYFIRAGHTRIGFIAGLRNSYTTMERTRGFLAALHQAGINVRPECCLVNTSFLNGDSVLQIHERG